MLTVPSRQDGDPRVRPATQASVAVTGDGEGWLIVGASPDLRQQFRKTRCCGHEPRAVIHQSPVSS